MYVYVSTISIYCVRVDNLFCVLNTITGIFAAQANLNAAVGVDVFFTMRVLYIIRLTAGKGVISVFDNF